MAGDWIKVEHVTPDKPEVVSIASELGIDQDAVVGKLLRIWIWADQQSLNGHALSVTKTFIDRITCHAGFATAMENSGWLMHENGTISLPHFDRHNGETSKARGLAFKRKRAERSRSQRDKIVTREEKRRDIPPTEVCIPECLNDSEFLLAWEDWKQHRKEIRKRMTPKATQGQLKKLEAMGPRRAVAAIRLSIAEGWTGIWEGNSNGSIGNSAGRGKHKVGSARIHGEDDAYAIGERPQDVS